MTGDSGRGDNFRAQIEPPGIARARRNGGAPEQARTGRTDGMSRQKRGNRPRPRMKVASRGRAGREKLFEESQRSRGKQTESCDILKKKKTPQKSREAHRSGFFGDGFRSRSGGGVLTASRRSAARTPGRSLPPRIRKRRHTVRSVDHWSSQALCINSR